MKKLFAITLGLAALVACNKKGVENVTPATPIRFAVSSEYTLTKATEAALVNGDEIQIIAGAPVSANSKATVSNDTELTLTTTLYWAPGQSTATDFVAIHPYANVTETTMEYNLFYENNHAYDYHKTFMTAHVSATPADPKVTLPFTHPFSKVIVNINNQLGSDAVESVVVKGIKMAGTLNLLTGAVTLDDAVSDVPASKLVENSYAMIVMPQSAQPTIEVTTHLGSVYTFALTQEFTFEVGKVATASLTLQSQGGSGQGQGDAVVFGFSVTDWAAAAEAPSIDQNPTVAMGSYWYVTGCVYDEDATVAAWSKDFPMTYKGQVNDEDVWEATLNYDESMAGEVEGSKGLKFRRYSSSTPEAEKWNDQLGMWGNDGSTYMNIAYNYDLATSTDGNKNVRFETVGNYKLTLSGNSLTVVKNQ